MSRFDFYETKPAGMEAYLAAYGWSFSKAMCEWAISKMKDNRTGEKLKSPLSKERVDEILKRQNITLENDNAYDSVYVANMKMADCYGGSITDEAHLAIAVKEYIDDKDGYEGLPFTRFYADCIGNGCAIIWEDMM